MTFIKRDLALCDKYRPTSRRKKHRAHLKLS